MTTVAEIAAAAFDGVAGAITGIVYDASMAYDSHAADQTDDYGSIADPVTESEDYGSIASAATETEDWGLITETTATYNTTTRQWTLSTTTLTGGRAIIGTKASIKSKFPEFTTGPDDTLIMLEGFSSIPDVGWRVTFDGTTRHIKAIGDISGAGEFAEVIAA